MALRPYSPWKPDVRGAWLLVWHDGVRVLVILEEDRLRGPRVRVNLPRPGWGGVAQLAPVVSHARLCSGLTMEAGHCVRGQLQRLRLREIIRALVRELVGGGGQAV